MPFELTILGSNSAIPAYGRHHTAQHLKIRHHQYLVDCGEGTQLQLLKYDFKAQRIEAIFISHLHGDHYLGLVGLLSSMHLQGRTKKLQLFGPPQLSDILTTQLRYSDTTFRYKVDFHPLDMSSTNVILETEALTVSSLPMQHRIPCLGFIFREKEYPYNLNKAKLTNEMSFMDISLLKKGEDVLDKDKGIKYLAKDFTLGQKSPRSYAYCSDTRYIPELSDQLNEVNLLYHEATFLTEIELRATNTYHTTAKQAAQLALDAKVDKLVIGHFSARYKDLQPLENEARKVFKNTYLAIEGKTFSLKN